MAALRGCFVLGRPWWHVLHVAVHYPAETAFQRDSETGWLSVEQVLGF